MENETIITIVVNATISIFVCIVTCLSQMIQLKTQFKNQLRLKYDEIEKNNLINDLKFLKAKYLEISQMISSFYLKATISLSNGNIDLDNDLLIQVCDFLEEFKFGIYKNNLFLNHDIKDKIDKGYNTLIDELEKCVSLDKENLNLEELRNLSNDFNKITEDYVETLTTILEGKLKH